MGKGFEIPQDKREDIQMLMELPEENYKLVMALVNGMRMAFQITEKKMA